MNCSVTSDFVAHYLKVTSDFNEDRGLIEPISDAEQFSDDVRLEIARTPEKSKSSVTDTTQDHSETPENKGIDRKHIGKFKVPIQYLHTPEMKRRVREMDEHFVKQLEKEMLYSIELSTDAAVLFLGL